MSKIKSFIKLVQMDVVSDYELQDKFFEFMASEYDDAYSYYVARGLIKTKQLSVHEIYALIYQAMVRLDIKKYDSKIVDEVMKMTCGKIDPSLVKQYIMNLVKE